MQHDLSILETPVLLVLKARYVEWFRVLNENDEELLVVEADIKALNDAALIAKFDQTKAFNDDVTERLITTLDQINEELNKRFP